MENHSAENRGMMAAKGGETALAGQVTEDCLCFSAGHRLHGCMHVLLLVG